MPRLNLASATQSLALAFGLVEGLVACDQVMTDLEPFPHGEPRLTDRGGFVVTLSAETDTAPPDDADTSPMLDELRLDVAFPGFEDPLSGQDGVPGVQIDVHVQPLGDDASASRHGQDIRVIELGEGRYQIVDLGIGSGSWALELDLRAGTRVEDHVEVAFVR